jgi:hypothetical protein
VSIGGGAFFGCTSLSTVSLPQATSIGDGAFRSTDLSTVSLPLAASIGDEAFSYCTSLSTVSLPLALSIGDGAFNACTSLSTVELPQAVSIGVSAFWDTEFAALSITLPQAAPAVSGASDSSYTYNKTVTIRTPADRTGYDAPWETNFKKAFGSYATITLNYEDI